MATGQDERRPHGSGERTEGMRSQRARGAQAERRRQRQTGARRSASAAGRGAPTKRPSARAGTRKAAAQRKRPDASRRRSRRSWRALLPGMPAKQALAAGAALCLVLALLVHHFLRFGITVNDQKLTIWRGTSIERLLDKGYADPKPGNLLAVDGSLLEKGKGERCTATIDGTPAELSAKVHRGAVVSISDGGDTTEEHTTTEEAIPPGNASGSREFDAYWTGSLHLLSDGQAGVRTVKTGKVSGKTVAEVTTPPIDAGYTIYTAHPDDKAIALTFDDGPWETTTAQILDILEEHGAKATFFTIGNQISSHPEALLRAKELGCQVCTHTWDHAAGSGGGVNLTYMTAEEQVAEVQKGYAAIAEVLGEEPAHIMRAPGGNFYGSLIDTLWPYVDVEVGWDVDTEDWSQPGADAIAQAILSVQPGQVILMHDGGGDRSQTVEGLRQAMPQLVEQGFSFVTIDELLAYGVPQASSGVVSIG